ncbi:hypothetical protein ACXR6G_18325 [Ancylomarina sp. YFZ004]
MIKRSERSTFSIYNRYYLEVKEIIKSIDPLGQNQEEFTSEYVYHQYILGLYKIHFEKEKIERLNLDVFTSRVAHNITECYLVLFDEVNEIDARDAKKIAKGIKSFLNGNKIKTLDQLVECTDMPLFCEILNKYGKTNEYKVNCIDKSVENICCKLFLRVLFEDLSLVEIEHFLLKYYEYQDHSFTSIDIVNKRAFSLARKLYFWKKGKMSKALKRDEYRKLLRHIDDVFCEINPADLWLDVDGWYDGYDLEAFSLIVRMSDCDDEKSLRDVITKVRKLWFPYRLEREIEFDKVSKLIWNEFYE